MYDTPVPCIIPSLHACSFIQLLAMYVCNCLAFCYTLLYPIALSRPSMKKFCKYVIKKAASKWDILGWTLLDEDQSTKIDTIKSNFQDSEKCCVEMFNYWLTTHPNVNWHDLVTALNTADLQSAATDLEKLFISMFCTCRCVALWMTHV